MKERNKAVPIVYLFLEKGDEVLVGLRTNTKFQNGMYSVPSGHVERGESPTVAIIREAREEAGIVIKAKDVKLAVVSYRLDNKGGCDRAEYFFRVQKYAGEIVNAEPEKCAGWFWRDMNKISPNIVAPQVLLAFQNIKRGISYMEVDENLNFPLRR